MGQDDFIERLYLENHDRLVRIAYRLIKNQDTAEDLAQQTFLEAMNNKNKPILITHPIPEAWLTKTLINLVKKEWRRTKNHGEVPLIEATDKPTEEIELPPEVIFPRELSKEDRDILIWRFEQGLSYEEIAKKLNISEGACRMRVSRAVQRCKALRSKDDSS